MKFNTFTMIIFLVCVISSFILGMATVHYQWFPAEQLSAIKQIVIADTTHALKPEPEQKHASVPKLLPATEPKLATNPQPVTVIEFNRSDYYYHKKSFFEKHGRHDYNVVFIGDSITDGADWEDLFPSLTIANRGIHGDTTKGVLERLESIRSTSADRAFIMLGINDFISGMSVDDVFEHYKNIVIALNGYGMKVYIQSTILAGKRHDKINSKIMDLNERLKVLATQYDTVSYIDLNAGLSKNSVLNAEYSRDDIHLNGEGYDVWKHLISGYVQ